jgi:hypothetical protein
MPTWLILVLAIVAPGGVIVSLIERVRRENNRDHARNSHMLLHNSQMLSKIDEKIEKVDDRLHHHIEWHAEDKK